MKLKAKLQYNGGKIAIERRRAKSSRLQLVQFLELAIFGISINSKHKSFAVLAEKSTQSPPLRPHPSIREPNGFNWSAGESASPALETLMLSLLGMHPGGEALK